MGNYIAKYESKTIYVTLEERDIGLGAGIRKGYTKRNFVEYKIKSPNDEAAVTLAKTDYRKEAEKIISKNSNTKENKMFLKGLVKLVDIPLK